MHRAACNPEPLPRAVIAKPFHDAVEIFRAKLLVITALLPSKNCKIV